MALRATRLRNAALTVLALAAGVCPARAQQPKPPSQPAPTASSSLGAAPRAQMVVHVRAVGGAAFDGAALVHLSLLSGALNTIAGTTGNASAEFGNLPMGRYVVEVTAPGYVTTREEATISFLNEAVDVYVFLQPDKSGTPPSGPALPPLLMPRVRKELEKAWEALRAGRLDEAEPHLLRAEQLAPGHPDVQYVLGVYYFQRKDTARAREHLEHAARLFPRHNAALLLLGQLLYETKDYAAAVPVLERAAEVNPQVWRTHWLLASTCYEQRAYERARGEAVRALELGKNEASLSYLVLGATLGALGERKAAAQAFENFLARHPNHPAAARVREWLTALRAPPAPPGSGAAGSPGAPLSPADAPPMPEPVNVPVLPSAAAPAPADTPRWHPPHVDDAVPPVIADTPCSLPQVLAGAGRRMKQLFATLQQFTATERVEYYDASSSGVLRAPQLYSGTYLAALSEVRPDLIQVDEMCNGSIDLGPAFGGYATTGLAALALILHPVLVGEFEMRCEGLGSWQGQRAWQIAFLQRTDLPNRVRGFRTRSGSYPIYMKGRVWVDAGSFQVLRLESDLIAPVPQIQLTRDHLAITYGPVHFAERGVDLWLPQSAELYSEIRGRRSYRRHSFSDFLLFSVDVNQTIADPKVPQ